MKVTASIIIQLILFAMLSCEKEGNKDDFPLSLTYELLDSIGNSKISFAKGEEIIFLFKITRKTCKIFPFI